MSVGEDELTRLNVELSTVETTIKRVLESGQNFKKGGVSTFSVEFSKLSQLRAERTELRGKIATWELYNG